MGNACSCKPWIKNELDFDLNMTDFTDPPTDGKWETKPSNVAKGSHGSFKAISKTCAMIGVEGKVTYTIANGMKFKIQFNVPYGATHPTCSCTADGVQAGNYKVTVDDVSGYNISPTITIANKT